ncbi:uncharacterized protein LDX57_004003 [Aspergillus melleus]|uniref:uncharacterized protein n=1 Tax=Aspergillus melleus TaxID=138277 RepID=UPI001E8D9CB9|nr:uncharacterized protein LDX57_004003 [Aspergillus melleus]KAH8426257.1 hypothetical protein LDX57_004003 [Aspergillus melleus]
MRAYHEEGSQYTGDSKFLPLDDNKGLLVEERLTRRTRFCSLPWVLTVIFGTLLILQNVFYLVWESGCRLGPVYDTDFEPMKHAISSVKVRFTSPLYVDDNGTFHRQEDPGAIKYVGGPEEELDANWDSLLGGRYFRLTEQETSTLNEDSELPSLSPWDRNGEEYFFAGIDMLHSLHCLNTLRKHLDPDFSDNVAKIAPEMRQLHLGKTGILQKQWIKIDK